MTDRPAQVLAAGEVPELRRPQCAFGEEMSHRRDWRGYLGGVKLQPVSHEVLPADEPLLNLPEVAERLDVPVTRVHDLLSEGKLLAVVRDGVRYVPAALFGEKSGRAGLNKFVTGAITLLADGGYDAEEILRYLFTEDESLPGRPVDALQGQLAREVLRRAQAMAI